MAVALQALSTRQVSGGRRSQVLGDIQGHQQGGDCPSLCLRAPAGPLSLLEGGYSLWTSFQLQTIPTGIPGPIIG